jgi:hypothetical protein
LIPAGNGDVNGDGRYDVTDAVYLLTWRFLGGPAPVPIGLPATGQTKCYGATGAVSDCASADYPGQDGFHQAGCPMAGRFRDNGDGTVSDLCTGLMWQKTMPGQYVWQDALKYCENLSLAGYTDWRLPNIKELQSIVDYSRGLSSLDPVFEVSFSYWCWSSTTFVGKTTNAWSIDLGTGLVVAYDGVFGYDVLAVRGGL